MISSVSCILESTAISYVKCDDNSGLHEMADPSVTHEYMLGLYRVFDVLVKRFLNVVWVIAPGVLH